MDTCERIINYLEEKDFYFTDVMFYGKFGKFDLYEVDAIGDWKHTHEYLDYLMEDFGFVLLKNIEVNPNGSDYGEIRHIYCHKEDVEGVKARIRLLLNFKERTEKAQANKI